MPGPWEDYAAPKADAKPWEQYAPSKAVTQTPDAPAAPAAPKPTSKNSQGEERNGMVEAVANMITGAVAKPVSDVAGIAAMIFDTATGAKPQDRDAEGFKNKVQEDLTYQPRSEAGKAISKYNPLALLGKGVDAVGKGAEELIAPPGSSTTRGMVGAGVHEAINQAPQFLGAKAGGAADAAGTAMRGGAEKLMTSALKPNLKEKQTGKAQQAVGTMLDEGLNVSPGGVRTLRDRIDGLNDQIAQQVQGSSAIVNKKTVLSNLNQVFADFEKQVNPTSDLVAIQKAWDDFDKHPLIAGNKIPVPLAQEMKQATYRSLGDKSYGELKGADITAQKALARGLKDEIAKALPEVSKLNAQESKLLNALPMVERRVLMDANKNPIGLGWLTANPAKMAGFMADRSPLFKSLIARMLNQGSKAAPAVGKLAPLGGVAVTQGADGIPPPPDAQ